MKKFIIAIAVMLVSATAVSAQNYNSAIGLEGGFDGIGLTYKNWNSDNTFMDYKANLDLNKHHMGLWASATKDWNVVLGNNFSFFYGLGAALGADFYESSAYFRAAVFGNLGFEYTLVSLPLAISLDWNPGYYMNFYDGYHDGFHGSFGYKEASLGVKYTF